MFMKKFIFKLLTILPPLMFSTPSYADWTAVAKKGADTIYVDFERLRKRDGNIYYWMLIDYSKPNEYGDRSTQVYMEGDCSQFRTRILKLAYYNGHMASGQGSAGNIPSPKWDYPSPESVIETVLNEVCFFD